MSMLADEIRGGTPETIQREPQSEELILAVTWVKPATRMCAAQGDAQMFKLLAQYYALVASEVAAAGGRVIKVMGDGTLLAFPADRARVAVESLRTLRTKANVFWQQIDERSQTQVKVGIGAIISGMIGPPGDERLDLIGSALNSLFKAPWGAFEVMPELASLLKKRSPRARLKR